MRTSAARMGRQRQKWWVPDSVIKGVVPYLEQRQDEKIDQKAIAALGAKVVEARMMPGRLKRDPTEDELHPRVERSRSLHNHIRLAVRFFYRDRQRGTRTGYFA
jgi:hypothetical protein